MIEFFFSRKVTISFILLMLYECSSLKLEGVTQKAVNRFKVLLCSSKTKYTIPLMNTQASVYEKQTHNLSWFEERLNEIFGSTV